MIISLQHKFIFIKNRKVGGSSLEKYLIDKLVNKKTDIHTGTSTKEYSSNNINRKDGGSVSGHMSIIDISKILNTKIDNLLSNFYIFSVERNPFDKCVSSYYFSRKKDESFLSYLNSSKNIPMDWSKYTVNNNIIGTVYRYENFSVVFEDLNYFLNLKSDKILTLDEFNLYNLKSMYRPKNETYKKQYNDETKKFVREHFKNEIIKFGYEF